MGLKNILNFFSKNDYQVVVEELISDLTPILNGYEFRFNTIDTLSKNEYSDVTWTTEKGDKFFQFHLHKLSGYYRWHEAIPDITPDYELTMIIGEGGHDFNEKKWSAVPLHLLIKNTKEIYTFNNLEELKTELSEIKNSLEGALRFFSDDFSDFLKIRKNNNMKKNVNQTITFDPKTGKDKIEIDQKDQGFMENYTK